MAVQRREGKSAVSMSDLLWQCGECGARFFRENLLQMHLEKFHMNSEKLQSSEEQPNISPDKNMVKRIRTISSNENSNNSHKTSETSNQSQGRNGLEQADEQNSQETNENESHETNDETALEINEEVSQEANEENAEETNEEYVLDAESLSSGTCFVGEDGNMYMIQHVEDENEGEQISSEIIMDTSNEGTEYVIETAENHEQTEGDTSNVECDGTVQGQVEYEVQHGEYESVEYLENAYEDESSQPEQEQGQGAGEVRAFPRILNTIMRKNVGLGAEIEYPCTQCDQTFESMQQLRAHAATHGREQRYSCALCGRGFYDVALLNLHAAAHRRGKKHECPHCFKYYTSEVYLKKHISMHLAAGDAARYKCGVCGERRAFRADLRQHMRAHAPQHSLPARAPAKQPRTVCTVCEAPLNRGQGNTRRCEKCHVKFQSLYAGRQSTSNPALSPDARPYTCRLPGCLKTFRHPGHLRRHHATHIDDDLPAPVYGPPK